MNARACMILVLSAAVTDASAGDKAGKVSFKVTVDGEEAQGCNARIVAPGAAARGMELEANPLADGPAANAHEVDPGKVDAIITCEVQSVKYARLVENVSVKTGKDSVETVAFEKASAIVHGNRGGERVHKGEYVLFQHGTLLEAARANLGSRVYVGAGNYDVKIESDVDGEPVTVWLQDQPVKTGRVQMLQADLGHGLLELVVLRNGKPAEGAGAITFPGQSNRIKEFTSGEPVPVSPGTYDVLGSLSSSFDFAEKRQRKVVIKPGASTKVSMDMPRGSVTTACSIGGKEAPATVSGYLPGAADYFNNAPCGQVLELTPGKYHLKITLDAAKAGYRTLGEAPPPETWHRNLNVTRGGHLSITADFTPVQLTVSARKNGEPTDAAVTVSKAGGAVLGGGPAGEALPVAPGRYDVEVLFPGRRGPSREVLRGVECTAGKPCIAGVNIERAVVILDVFKGGSPAADAEVSLFKQGSDVPYIKGKSGEELEVPPGDYVPELRHAGKRKQLNRMRLRPGDREQRQVEVE